MGSFCLDHIRELTDYLWGNNAPAQQPTTAPVSSIDPHRVVRWLNAFQAEHHKLQGLLANGLSGFLSQEIEVVTSLVREGNELISHVDCVAMPYLRSIISSGIPHQQAILEKDLAAAKVKLGAMSEEEIAKDRKLEKKWQQLGLAPSILEQHADCARFLMNSKLVFSIVGYRETCHNPELHDVKLDGDGHPLIKVCGEWKRWELIKQQLTYDEKSEEIKSLGYPGNVVQVWTYLADGLMPIHRLKHDQIEPIYQLSADEYQSVLTKARSFYDHYPEIDRGIPKDCVVQLFTTPRRSPIDGIVPRGLMHDYLYHLYPIHIGIRIITADGSVRSFGMEMTAQSYAFFTKDPLSRLLTSYLANISKAGDYEEFRPIEEDGRIVTSIPLSTQRASNILGVLGTPEEVRFSYLKQNCSNIAAFVLKEAGYGSNDVLDTRTTLGGLLYHALPDGKALPFIGPLIGLIQSCARAIFDGIEWITPTCVQKGCSFLAKVVTFIPGKISTFLQNLLAIKLGASQVFYPLPEGVKEDEFYDRRDILNFSSIIRSWSDLFDDEINVFSHSDKFIRWQKGLHSTFIQHSTGRPILAIVPAG